jgi:hypothetical protein
MILPREKLINALESYTEYKHEFEIKSEDLIMLALAELLKQKGDDYGQRQSKKKGGEERSS